MDSSSHDSPSKKTPATGERRRSPRGRVSAPVLVRVGDTPYEGTAENLSYAGVMILSHGELPEVGARCDVTIQLAAGQVEARGRVVRHEVRTNCFAVDLEHVDVNGEILLATILMSGG